MPRIAESRPASGTPNRSQFARIVSTTPDTTGSAMVRGPEPRGEVGTM